MTTNQRLFLDIHAIQTLPPSNINRDDTGSPKTTQYGGVRRSRVSSQSWKKAMRKYFQSVGGDENTGYRTVKIVEAIAKEVINIDHTIEFDESLNLSKGLLDRLVKKKNGNEEKLFPVDNEYKLASLFFISKIQSKRLAAILLNKDFIELCDKFDSFNEEAKRNKKFKKSEEYKEVDKQYEQQMKELKQIIKDTPSLDVALFGRMLATDPSLNEDASSQVAHAISTHAVQTEFDFFTAVDDLAPEDNAGAGMLGTVEFNSSTLYRYANVAIHELSKQLGDEKSLINSLKLFIEAFANSLPTGKVNTFANQTLPQALVITVRNDRPVNLVSAFEEPVKSTDGYVTKSIDKLSQEFTKVGKFVSKPLLTFYVSLDDVESLKQIGEEKDSVSKLLVDFSEGLMQLIKE